MMPLQEILFFQTLQLHYISTAKFPVGNWVQSEVKVFFETIKHHVGKVISGIEITTNIELMVCNSIC